MTFKAICSLASIALLCFPATANAWGPAGHRIVGQAAFELLDPPARDAVAQILAANGAQDAAQALDEACNWPDVVRSSAEWAWSAPLHYVNLPRHARDYERERDCPEGRCVTEGILHYASLLSRPPPDTERRWQAFAFLCHLVGDLHQPLHAGFRDDRGANRIGVEYRGEHGNLHEWWDSVVVQAMLQDERHAITTAATAGRALAGLAWNPEDVRDWTGESHGLAIDAAYPPDRVIDEAFAARSWQVVERQWARAAGRLASLLNTLFTTNETGGAAPPATPDGAG